MLGVTPLDPLDQLPDPLFALHFMYPLLHTGQCTQFVGQDVPVKVE